MDKLKIGVTQAAAGAAVLTLELGLSWVTTGYGLHPIAAGALATVLILAPWMIPSRAEV